MKRNLILTTEFKKKKNKEIYLINEEIISENNLNFYKSKKINILKNNFKLKKKTINKYTLYCEKIYDSLIKDIAIKLNEILKTNFSERAWKILLGHWLKRFIYLAYSRYYDIKKIIRNKKIRKVFLLNTNNFQLATDDTSGITYASFDEKWNNKLYKYILEHLRFDNLIEILGNNKNKKVRYNTNYEIEKIKKKKIKFKIFNFLISCLSFFFIKKKFIFYKTYLPLILEKKLEIKFLSLNKPEEYPSYLFNDFDTKLRNKLNFYKTGCDTFEMFLRKIVNYAVPLNIIENFKKFEIIANRNFYSGTKFVITANGFDFDEAFKIFVAKSVDKGAKYFIIQHGASYFSDIRNNYSVEFEVADKFLSWGHKDNNKVVPLFNILTTKRKVYPKNIDGFLTVILNSPGARIYPERYFESKNTFKDTYTILNLLNLEVKKKTLIRFHSSHPNRFKFLKNKFIKNSYWKIDNNKISWNDLDKTTRLFFFNSDSTSLLENLALNIPSVCYWGSNYEFINESFYKKYDYLIEGKILFKNKKQLVSHIEKNWLNFNDWWFSKKTQKCIKNFNRNFNILCDINDPLEKIKNVISNESK